MAIAPPGLSRVFYSDNGSTAAEVAVKMAYQYWQLRGETQRTEFVCLRDAYHGDTIGSVSVGGIDLFHATFRTLLFETHHAEPGDAADMRRLLEAHGERVAAVVVEPLVQGAAGMLVHPEGYLRAVRELCDEFGVLLICDEVAVGFGRTGTMFACEQEDVAPDLMCVAKGITGGYLPLAATLTHRGASTRPSSASTTSSRRSSTATRTRATRSPARRRWRRSTCSSPSARSSGWRRRSSCSARCSTSSSRRSRRRRGPPPRVHDRDRAGRRSRLEARMGHQVTLAARRRGAIVRPLGDVVVLMPPLSISEAS